MNDRLTLYGFADTGMSFDSTGGNEQFLLSAGVGIDYTIASNFKVSLVMSQALEDGPITKQGTSQISGGFKINF